VEFESTLSESQSEVLTANTKATPNMSMVHPPGYAPGYPALQTGAFTRL